MSTRKYVFAGLFCALGFAFAQSTGGPVVTPATGTVFQGQTVTLTSQKPVTWSLVAGSYGTLTVNSSTSATYTAPVSVTSGTVFRGCQTAPSDSVWNMRIDNLPVESNSATWVQTMSPYSIAVVPDWGTNVVNNATPKVNETFVYTPGSNGLFSVPSWPAQKRQGGVFVSDKNGSDHHLMSIDSGSCYISEMYNNYFSPRGCSSGNCTATSGLKYRWSTYALPNGSTAAGNVPYTPLLLHLAEIKAGGIHHALAFDLGSYRVNAGSGSHPVSYWPSNNTYGPCGGGCPNAPPYGARFRLKSTFDVSSFSPTAQTILTALKQYGMFLTDIGIDGEIYADTDLSEDPTVMAAVNEIKNKKISLSNFEAVDESSFMVNPNSSQVNPLNGYETPEGYAVVTATDAANPSSKTLVPVAVEANYPTVNSPTMYIVAGSPAHLIYSAYRDGHYDGTHWSLISGPGSITLNGLYTPPASVSAPTQAVVMETGSNPEQFAKVYITVLPKGLNPDGSIRIDSGHAGATVDGSGNTWLGDQALEIASSRTVNDYPNWPQQSNPEIKIYQSSFYTYESDILYSFVVPNGNYKVRLMFGQPYDGCQQPCGPYPGYWHAPVHLEANGQIAAHNFDFGKPINYQRATPVDAFIPARVTDGNLYVALRPNVPDDKAVPGSHVTPLLAGLEVIPDNSTTPYLAIDTQQTTTVAPGATLQLYAVGWYMSNSVTWSIVSGPGSIDQTGLYTAPAGSSSPQTVTIQAVSTVNGAVKATVTLTIPPAS